MKWKYFVTNVFTLPLIKLIHPIWIATKIWFQFFCTVHLKTLWCSYSCGLFFNNRSVLCESASDSVFCHQSCHLHPWAWTHGGHQDRAHGHQKTQDWNQTGGGKEETCLSIIYQVFLCFVKCEIFTMKFKIINSFPHYCTLNGFYIILFSARWLQTHKCGLSL